MSARAGHERALVVGLVGLVALVALACVGQSTRLPPEAIAAFGDRYVTYADFESWVRDNTGDDTVGLSALALSALFAQYLDEQLLVHWAGERGLVADGDPEASTRALLEDFPPEPVTEADIARHYRDHNEEFRRPERVRLRQLLFQTRAEADAAAAEIEAGTSFDQIADRHLPGLGARAGSLGELTREDLPPALVEAVFSTEPGSTTGVLANETGINLFLVEARRPAETLSLEDVAPRIRRTLETAARSAQLERLAAEARDRYNLVLAAERLPFTLHTGPEHPDPQDPDSQQPDSQHPSSESSAAGSPVGEPRAALRGAPGSPEPGPPPIASGAS